MRPMLAIIALAIVLVAALEFATIPPPTGINPWALAVLVLGVLGVLYQQIVISVVKSE